MQKYSFDLVDNKLINTSNVKQYVHLHIYCDSVVLSNDTSDINNFDNIKFRKNDDAEIINIFAEIYCKILNNHNFDGTIRVVQNFINDSSQIKINSENRQNFENLRSKIQSNFDSLFYKVATDETLNSETSKNIINLTSNYNLFLSNTDAISHQILLYFTNNVDFRSVSILCKYFEYSNKINGFIVKNNDKIKFFVFKPNDSYPFYESMCDINNFSSLNEHFQIFIVKILRCIEGHSDEYFDEYI